MKNISITPYLKKKYKTDNKGIINIRITENRKSKYNSLKIKLATKFWNDIKHEVRASCLEHEKLNEIISNEVKALEEKFKSNVGINKASSGYNSFLDYMELHKDMLLERKQYGTYKRYQSTTYHIEKHLDKNNKANLLFSEIDRTFIRKFETYLLKTGMKQNTSVNYIRCIRKLYTQAKDDDLISVTKSPFDGYPLEREKVNKVFLTQNDVNSILYCDIKQDDVLFKVKNGFLFQIFAQGIRISDLLTIRFENINIAKDRLEFYQFKTKKFISIRINSIMTSILKYSIDKDLTYLYDTVKENVKQHTKRIKMSYNDVLKRKQEISDTVDPSGKTIENYNKLLVKLSEDIRVAILIEISEYKKNHSKQFIFRFLKNDDFQNVVFNDNPLISKYQSNQMQSKTALYNKRLKVLQVKAGISINLTSHIARHTYTNLMLEKAGADVYSISKSLGHSKLITTERYIQDFNEELIDTPNEKMNSPFTRYKI